jgi:Flp pilus assembly protein TadG
MKNSLALIKHMRVFARDRRGSVALMFGLMLVPLILTVGIGVDYGQALNFKSSLQSAVDAAALAGASTYTATSGTSTPTTVATNYMKNAITKLPSTYNVSYTVTPSTASAGSNTTGYLVSVTATAKVPTSFMSLASINTTNVSVSATAENPVTTMNISTTGFSSSACDSNTIYWYPIPSSANVSTYVPPTSALTEVWTNSNQSATPTPISLTSSSEQIGFALKNVTGGLCGYGSNSYGGKQGASHMMYSNLYPPSKEAYPSVTQNRSLQVVQLPTGGTLASTLSSLPATSFTSDPTNAAPTCGGLASKTWVYAWNDMGGTTDDLDYNDVAYTFSCSGVNGSTNFNASGVVLIK